MPKGYGGAAMLAGLACDLNQIPSRLPRSATSEQGSKWACWETIAGGNEIAIWCCEPHVPWQRGQIENRNRQSRFWFPRGTDLSIVEQADIDPQRLAPPWPHLPEPGRHGRNCFRAVTVEPTHPGQHLRERNVRVPPSLLHSPQRIIELYGSIPRRC